MKRFASHYLFMPDVGFIKQQVVEITDEGVVRDTFPLTEEIESVEWMPGVIVLLPADQLEEIKNTGMILKNIPVFQINPSNILNQSSRCFEESLKELKEKGKYYSLFYFIRLILFPCSLSTELGTDYCGSYGYIE